MSRFTLARILVYGLSRGLRLVSLCWVVVGLLSVVTPGDAQELRAIQGRVIDLETGEGIPDVLVRAAGTQMEATTGASGAFLLEGLPAGERLLVFSHLGYGEHQQVVPVADEGAGFEVRLSVEAIEIAPLVVETTTRDARERRGSRVQQQHRRLRADPALSGDEPSPGRSPSSGGAGDQDAGKAMIRRVRACAWSFVLPRACR